MKRQRITVREAATVDLTAFLSLMVILAPFLLVTAVFTQTPILELQPQRGEASRQRCCQGGAGSTGERGIQQRLPGRVLEGG